MAVESHTFLALTTDSAFVAHRVHKEGTNKSILVGTLLALLRQSLFVGDGVPVNLANILSGASRDHDEQITVATSQVPSFDRDFQNPTYVYRSLGVLRRVRINFDPPPSVFDPVRELCSIDQADDPKTVQFEKRWRMFGLDLANHFIIIFNDTCPESSPLQWSNGISSLESRSSSNSFDLMARGGAVSLDSSRNSPVPALPLGADYTNHYHYSSGITSSRNSPGSAPTNTVTQLPCDVRDGDVDRHSSPTTGGSFSVDYGYPHEPQTDAPSLFLRSDFNDNPTLHLGQISYATPAVTPDIVQNHVRVDILTAADVERLCSEHGIQSDVVRGAHKQRRGDSGNVDRESIFTMALAHRKMALILVELGLQKCIYENYTHAKGERVVEISGKRVSINSMLSAFSWKPDSYKNKSIWYKWAHDKVVSKQRKAMQSIPMGRSETTILGLVLLTSL